MDEAEELLGYATSAITEISPVPLEVVGFLIYLDDEPGAAMLALEEGAVPPADVFVGKRAGAFATRIGWSPDERPTRPCWSIVAVCSNVPARMAVGPYDDNWFAIPTSELPWYAAATAGGIRASLEDGEPLVFKTAEDARLFGRVRGGDTPPTDEQGLI